MANISKQILAENKKQRDAAFYNIRSILGCADWALFYILLGGRQAGKSYCIDDYFLKYFRRDRVPYYHLRLNEGATKKLLANNAEKLVDPDLMRKYNLDLKTKGSRVYNRGRKMADVLALSTFYSDKGVGYFDKDFLNFDPKMQYHLLLDEFQKEKTEKSQGDIAYQFVNQLENLLRDTHERTKIFLVANTLEEASDILTLFNFIPTEFGRYYLKSKRAVIDYIEPSKAYKEMRSKSIANLLMPNASNFTNVVATDDTLLTKQRLVKPTMIIAFQKDVKFTLWDGGVIAAYNGEKCPTIVAMRPYLDLVYSSQLRDEIINNFDSRCYLYHNMITFKRFQQQIRLLKPRKQ